MAVSLFHAEDGVKASDIQHNFTVSVSVTDKLILLGIVIDSDTVTVSSILNTNTTFTFIQRIQNTGFPTMEIWGTFVDGVALGSTQITLSSARPITYAVIALDGFNETELWGGTQNNSATSTTPIMATSSSIDGMVVGFLSVGGSSTLTISSGALQTNRTKELSTNKNMAVDTEPGDSLVTMSWTLDLSRSWTVITVDVPAAASPIVYGAVALPIVVGFTIAGETFAVTPQVAWNIPVGFTITGQDAQVDGAVVLPIAVNFGIKGTLDPLIDPALAPTTASAIEPDSLQGEAP